MGLTCSKEEIQFLFCPGLSPCPPLLPTVLCVSSSAFHSVALGPFQVFLEQCSPDYDPSWCALSMTPSLSRESPLIAQLQESSDLLYPSTVLCNVKLWLNPLFGDTRSGSQTKR